MAQSKAFAEEKLSRFSKQQKDPKAKQNSKLYSLDPFVGEDQVLYVCGRLNNSSLNNSCTHPILLRKNGTVTELFIKWCHDKTAHGGRDITLGLGEMRSNGYWIIDANSKTTQIIFNLLLRNVRKWPDTH